MEKNSSDESELQRCSLIEKFGQSLLSSYIKDAMIDTAENIIDSKDVTNTILKDWNIKCLIDNPVLKNTPIIEFILGSVQTGYNVYACNLLKQTGSFLDEFEKCKFNLNDLSEKSKRHLQKCLRDYKNMEEELGRVLVLIDRNVDTEKSRYQARFLYKYYSCEITQGEFHELCEITGRLFLEDLETLKFIYEDGSVSDNDLNYRHERLISLGLLKSPYDHRGAVFRGENDNLIILTEIGKKFCDIVFLPFFPY